MSSAPAYTLTDPEARREFIAASVKEASRVELPRMRYWNYGPCEHHEEARPDCEYRACGGDLFDHQTVTTAWLFFQKRGMVASAAGTGKTNAALALLALLKEYGLLRRAVFVINSPAVTQWADEAARFVPDISVGVVSPGLPKKRRVEIYSQSWDVLLVGAPMLVRDSEILKKLGADFVLSDDVDALLRHQTKTHKAFCALANQADRVVVMNYSNLQTKLQELHAAMMPIGGRFIWGSLPMFERRYLLREWDEVRVPGGRKIKVARTVGVQNGQELRDRLSKWVIRYTYEDLGNDLKMPELVPPTNVWLDLYPAQRKKYEALREGVLEIQRKEGTDVRHVTALSMVNYGSQICAGLAALGEEDGPETSVKLDWVEEQLQSSWEGHKVVIFAKNIGTIRALQARLSARGIGYATVWGEDADAESRKREVSRFWEDPNCQVFMGTAAIERSLNLQVANIVCNIDLHLNPERIKQILGRVRRAGSSHSHIFVFSLLAKDTQEEGYLSVLQKREALTSFVWDDDETVFEKLSGSDLLRLIRP